MNSLSYEVKESVRAKHVRLKVSLYDASLVVVVPKGFDRGCIPEVLREKRSWIERARRQVVEQRRLAESEPLERWPGRLSLRAVDEEWAIEYQRAGPLGVAVLESGAQRLQVRGDIGSAEACQAALGEWVRAKARSYLVPWLTSVSAAQELPMGRAVVRAQRTCWATCSTRRTISINRKLLFLPPALVEYVFLHELCHTVHMDHSSRFWDLVARRLPEYRACEVALRTAWRYVPTWLGANGRRA
jgi:hypothetical protein